MRDLPGPLRALPGASAAAGRYASAFVKLRFRVASDQAAADARRRVVTALDRLEDELDGGEYLVGDRFTVADLTASALFYPLVLPPEGPQLPDPPAGYESFRAPLADRPGYRWVERMFREHRKPVRASDEVVVGTKGPAG